MGWRMGRPPGPAPPLGIFLGAHDPQRGLRGGNREGGHGTPFLSPGAGPEDHDHRHLGQAGIAHERTPWAYAFEVYATVDGRRIGRTYFQSKRTGSTSSAEAEPRFLKSSGNFFM